MSNFVCKLHGARGRTLEIYDNKCVIRTSVTVGSVLTHNATDGMKTVFYIDCTGVQFKESRLTIGYLQLETPSMQMNNQASNFFSENTFTFEEANGISNSLMNDVCNYIVGRIEHYKYGTAAEPYNKVPGSFIQRIPKGQQAPNLFSDAVQAKPTASAQPAQSQAASAANWTCSCGRVNARYVSTCACGKNKRDLQ